MKTSRFRSSTRTALAVVLGMLLWAPISQAETPVVHVLSIDGPIQPASAEYLLGGMDEAAADGAAAVLVILDTPGGLLQSTREMVQALLDPPVPVIFLVGPSGAEATSAGAFLVMAANIAAMAPGTSIGASTPVSAGGGADMEGAMGEKVMNSTVSFAKSIAEQRGRNMEWAESAVRDAVSVTDSEALELGIIDTIAANRVELVQKIDGQTVSIDGRPRVLRLAGAEFVAIEPTLRQKIVGFFADPTIAYFLLLAGVLGLYLEISNPGGLVPGVIGAICLFIAAASFQILPINMSGLGLLFLGMGLLVAELFVPSFGILGLGGFIAFVLGSLYLFEAPGGVFAVDRGVIGGAATAVATIMLVMATLVVGSYRKKPITGAGSLVGEICTVRDVQGDSGHVFLNGEIWAARWTGPMAVGDKVQVENVDGLSVGVVRAEGEKERI